MMPAMAAGWGVLENTPPPCCAASDLSFHPDHGRLIDDATLLRPWESIEGSVRMSTMFARPLNGRGARAGMR